MGEDTARPQLRGLSEAAVLAALSAVAYLGAYSYEVAYADHFGVPAHLVRVGVETPLRVAAALLLFLFLLMGPVSALADDYLQRRGSPARTAFDWILRWTNMALVAFVVVAMSRFEPFWIMFALVALVVVVVLDVVISRAMRGKWPPSGSQRSDSSDDSLFGVIRRRVTGLMFVALVTFTLAGTAGRGTARKETSFLTFKDAPSREFVVVQSYGDFAIALELERKSKRVGSAVRLIPLASAPPMVLEKVGPLSRAVR